MRCKRLALASLAVAVSGQAALGQELPRWPIAEVCVKDSAPGQCQMFEARAQRAVSAGWGVLPDAVRKACLAEVKQPRDHSWRLLSDCLETQVLSGLDKRAIKTAATPAEPVPAPRPAAAAPAAGSDPATAIAQPPREAAPTGAISAPPPSFSLPSGPPL